MDVSLLFLTTVDVAEGRPGNHPIPAQTKKARLKPGLSNSALQAVA